MGIEKRKGGYWKLAEEISKEVREWPTWKRCVSNVKVRSHASSRLIKRSSSQSVSSYKKSK